MNTVEIMKTTFRLDDRVQTKNNTTTTLMTYNFDFLSERIYIILFNCYQEMSEKIAKLYMM